jgi:hypothetical protein
MIKDFGFQSCGKYYQMGKNNSYIEYLKNIIVEIKQFKKEKGL